MNIACDSEVFLKSNIIQTEKEDEEQLKRIHQSGFRHLNYSINTKQLMSDNWKGYFLNLRALFDKYEMGVSIVHSPGAIDYDKLDEYNEELIKRTIEACGIIGCGWIVDHPKDIECDYTKSDIKMIKEKNVEYYKTLTPLLEKHNVGLAIENLLDTVKRTWKVGTRVYCDTITDLIELVDDINHEKVGICIDTGHLNTMMGVNIYEEFESVGSRLKALHINDNDAVNDLHLIPYLGNLDWQKIMSILKKIDYQGDFSYEASSAAMKFPEELRVKFMTFKYEVAKYLVNL